jgi:uncharacterized protein YecT (DUF1311 family)
MILNWIRLGACSAALMSAFAIPNSAIAQDDRPKCNPAGTQLELNVCAADALETAESALEATFFMLLALLEGDAPAIEALNRAQAAWAGFRDADIEAHFPLAGNENPMRLYGSMYPMNYAYVRASLARDREAQLQVRINAMRSH